jgi:uncharacterized membrane protein YgdD (TMEM256/DUF423 family)
MKQKETISIIASIYGLSAVALGAFGAHMLKDTLSAQGTTSAWQTAVDYQMWHALALLLVAHRTPDCRLAKAASLLFCAGTFLFSASLYWLALGGPRWLGPVTPLGGSSLILGWGLLIGSFARGKKQSDKE